MRDNPFHFNPEVGAETHLPRPTIATHLRMGCKGCVTHIEQACEKSSHRAKGIDFNPDDAAAVDRNQEQDAR
jgi:hypothetical protein